MVDTSDLVLAVSGAMGFAEGVIGNASGVETKLLQTRAVVSDNIGNNTPYTQSATNLDVDKTPPSLITSAKVYNDKGIQNAAREVITFRLSESVYTNAGALQTDNFLFVNGTNIAYGNPGFSVDDPGAGTNDVDANYVRYESDGGASSADATVSNINLIWVESNNNNSNWSSSASPVTRVRYVQLGATSTSALVIRDAAGNELGAFTLAVSSGDVIPPALSPDVMTLYPRAGNPEKIVFALSEPLSTSTTANAVTGFTTSTAGSTIADATYSEASAGVCPCIITLTRGGATPWTVATTVSYDHTTGNVLDLAGVPNELVTFAGHAVVVETIPPSITAVSIPNVAMRVGNTITATITTANDDGDDVVFTSGTIGGFALTAASIVNSSPTSKTIQFTITEGGTDYAAAADIPVANLVLTDGQGNNSSAFNADIVQASDPIDAHSPTITSITNSVTTIYEGALVQTVTVVYNETMSTAFQPTISVSTGNTHWTQAPSGGTNGWVGATYTATLTHDTFEEELGSATTSVAVGGARDAAGNPNLGTLSSTGSPFIIDTKKPTVTVGVSPSTINVTNHTITVTVDYNESMNTTIDPTIAFTIGAGVSNFNATGAGVWSNGDKRYVRSYQQLNNLTSLTNSVTVTNGRDDAGNTQLSAGSGNFVIDTQRPTVVSVSRVGSQFTNATTVFYNVTFSEVVSNLAPSDFTPFIVLNNPSVDAGDVVSIATTDNITYTIEVENVTGDGDIRLDVNTSGSITDARGNVLNTGFTSGQIYTVDNTPALIQSIVISSPVNLWSAANGRQIHPNDSASFTVTFTEPVTGVDASDFTITNTALTRLSIAGPIVVTGSGTTWNVKLKGINLIALNASAQFKIDLIDDNSILDLAGLPLGGAATGDGNSVTSTLPTSVTGATDYYTAVFPEPVNIASGYSLTGTTNTSFSFQFNSPLTPASRINYFVVQVKRSNVPSFVDPTDGQYPAGVDDADFSDGQVGMLITNPSNGALISFNTTSLGPLTSGFTYNVRIISVSYSGQFNSQEQLDFYTGSTLNDAGNTTTATAGTVTSVSTPGVISSLTTASTGIPVYTFTLNEDGTTVGTKALDNAPTKFNTLVFKPGGTNNVSNWNTTIAGAQLTDLDGNVIGGLDVDINATDITFTNIPSLNNTQLGYLDDNENKQYTLRIWLADPLVVADNSRLDFRVDNTSFPLYDNSSSSQVSSKFTTTSAESGTIRIDVKATKLVFVIDPQPTIGVGINFNQSSQAQPRIEARDANDNLDTDYNASFNVTPSAGVVTSHTNFSSGVLTLANFNFSTAGSRTITISGNAVATPIVYPALTGAGVHAVSSSVNAVISNKTRISEGNLLPTAERDFIPSTTNAVPAFFNFDFTITDDVAVDLTDHTDDDALPTIVQSITITRGDNNGTNVTPGPNDDATTFDEWTRVIAGAQLKVVGNTQTVTGIISNGSILFNIPAGSFMETVPNNGALTYELRIWLRNPIDPTVGDILDNKDFVFAINQGNVGIGSANTTSTLANSNASTGDGKNVVTVTANRLVFTKQPATSQFYDAPITPYPVVRALDPNGNLDRGYTGTPTLTTTPNGSITYPILAGTETLVNTNGKVTFDSVAAGGVLTITSAGNGANGEQTRFVVSGGLNDQGGTVTAANSILFTMNYSGTSNIVRDGSFTHPTDIPSINNREALNLTAANSIALDRFILQDGGVSNDADGTKTKLQSIILNLSNHTNIRRIGLYDENDVEIKELDSTAFTAGGNITFNAFANAFEANDDDRTTKKLTVRVSFKADVTDNQQINVSVVSASASTSSSQLVPVSIPGDNLGTDKNKVEVVATKISFTTMPTTASISTPLSPQVVVSAQDAYGNIDSDYNGPINLVDTDPASDLLFHTLYDPSGSFLNGEFTYPSNFQFDIGFGSVKLTIEAGSGSGLNNLNAVGPLYGVSSSINVISSFESGIKSTNYNPPAAIPTLDINNYINYQGSSITGLSDGYTLDQLVLNDGSQDVTPGDADGANTVLTNLTLGISNPQSIRRIAIYQQDNVTLAWSEVQEKDNSDIVVTNGYGQLPFTGLNITALDNGVKNIRVLATFFSSSSAIQDNDSIQISILAAATGTGSKFYPDGTTNTTIGGVAKTNLAFPLSATSISAGSKGAYQKIEVLATKFDFIQQPPAYAGINQPVPLSGSPIQVHARDGLNNLDTDFDYISNPAQYSVSVSAATAAANPFPYSGTFRFINGVLLMPTLEYSNTGNGTLTIASVANPAITSNVNNTSVTPNIVATPSTPVRVMHVSTAQATGGVVTGNNLRGGITSVVIFGVTFSAANADPTNHPKLKQFTFSFDKAFRTGVGTATLKNFRVFESTTGTYQSGVSQNVTLLNGVVTEGKSAALVNANHRDLVNVTFPAGSYRDLSGTTTYSYFLMCDVDASANAGTPSLQPQMIADGYHSTTYSHIQVTEGSATAVGILGKLYSFASTKPPKIVFSNPANGQLNVDPDQATLQIMFDVPVFTHDHKAYLYDSLNNKVADLIAINGRYGTTDGTTGGNNTIPPTPPLTFNIPANTLNDNSVYYILIDKAVIDTQNPANSRGIADDLSNLFGGITYPGGLRFKTANQNPPKMTATDGAKYYISGSGGTINATFDQRGKAYFMVTDVGAPVPSVDQIKGTNTYPSTGTATIYTRDSLLISQIGIPQFGNFVSAPALLPNTTYNVWMYAENDALPTPKAVSHPFLSELSAFNLNTGLINEPTFQISFTTPSTTLKLNKPLYQICSNSNVILSAPIIIEEGTSGQFFNSQLQSFNLLLPEGYQFDKTVIPVVETIGEFTGIAKAIFINNTVLKIEFQNYGTSVIDKIIISNMSVLGDVTAPTAFIKRLGGSAIPALDDDEVIATLGVIDAQPGSFTNSYTTLNNFTSIGITNAVTVIPDNFSDPSLPSANSVRLIPVITEGFANGDYGPNVFTGPGVTNEVLSLNGVALNTSFDITLTHTDMNGCVSTFSEQYRVYDHNTAIPGLPLKQGIVNTNFPGYAPSFYPKDSITFATVAGYLLDTLFASVPARITAASTQRIKQTPEWQELISKIPQRNPIEKDTTANPIPTNKYHNYALDYKSILNDSIDNDNDIIDDPYNTKLSSSAYFWFKDRTLEKRPFWKGGSMGVIELTGIYQSIADEDIRIPLRQEVEIFLPPIPVVEVANTEISGYDNTDPLRPDPALWPLGTPIFCEGGNDILITGYPRAVQGQSTGSFQLLNAADSAAISIAPGAFVDNGNGTAILKPGSLNNAYRDILVLYRFKENISPIDSVGGLVIRVSPNPIADFSAASLLDSANTVEVGRPSVVNAYCEDNMIQFSNTSSFPASTAIPPPSYTYIASTNQRWTIGDPTAVNTEYNNLDSALFIYKASGKYNVTLSVLSQYNCPSQVVSKTIYIGAIPTAPISGPVFSMNGIHTEADLEVVDNSVVADALGVDSEIASAYWVYSLSPNDTVTNLTYQFNQPGHHTITLLSTTSIRNMDNNTTLPGCTRAFQRPVIIVPFLSTTEIGNEYRENFEDPDPAKQWQTSSTDPAISSWVRGDVNKSSTVNLATNVWATSLNNKYNTGERSYLYSPAYDLSDLVRPKVGFDHVAYMGQNDGVALEFSIDTFNIADPEKKWYRLGSNANGNNWYNKQGLASQPGDQTDYVSKLKSGDFGWSAQDDTVLHSQHTLSPDIPAAWRKHVIFRFALASTLASSEEGFAFDDFRVGERTRLVLIENFTNLGNPQTISGVKVEKEQNDFLNGGNFRGVGTDIVKLNYHVAFPGLDPLNDDYPADPSARALFYNISQTPSTRIDGHPSVNGQNEYVKEWGVQTFNIRTLQLAEADIEITPTALPGGPIEVLVKVTAREDLPADTTILHVAFVEDSVHSLDPVDQGMVKTDEEGFSYVVKKMLPSALGTKFVTPLLAGQIRTFGPMIWTPDLKKLYEGADDLSIVAFLQNEVTREIYQAQITSPLNTELDDPDLITGVEDPEYASKINLYPNPADNEVNIVLPAPASKQLPMIMVDAYGRTVHEDNFAAGEQFKTLKTNELAGGVYFIQISTPDGNFARRKVMVIHR